MYLRTGAILKLILTIELRRVVEWFKVLVLKARLCFSYISVLEDKLTCSVGSVPKKLTMF